MTLEELPLSEVNARPGAIQPSGAIQGQRKVQDSAPSACVPQHENKPYPAVTVRSASGYHSCGTCATRHSKQAVTAHADIGPQTNKPAHSMAARTAAPNAQDSPPGVSVKVPHQILTAGARMATSPGPPEGKSVKHDNKGGLVPPQVASVGHSTKASAVKPPRQVSLYDGGDPSTVQAQTLSLIMSPEQAAAAGRILAELRSSDSDKTKLQKLIEQKGKLGKVLAPYEARLDEAIAEETIKVAQNKKRARDHRLYNAVKKAYTEYSKAPTFSRNN